MCDCSICIAEKGKNIAKFLLNLPFQLAKFCILDAKFEIFFAKNRGDRLFREEKKRPRKSLRYGRGFITADVVIIEVHCSQRVMFQC